MIKTLHIESLINSIPFYNALLHTKPTNLSYNSADYVSNGMHVHLIESPIYSIQTEKKLVGSIYLPTALDFKERFRDVFRFQSVFNKTHCKVLDSSFQVSDPDGNTWLVTNKLLNNSNSPLEMNPCYLEPINF